MAKFQSFFGTDWHYNENVGFYEVMWGHFGNGGGHKIQPEFENPYLVASKQILGIAYNRCFQTSLDKWALFFCTWPQQSSLSLQTEMNQTCSGCSDYSANYLENAASGASGAFGHFTGNHVILRTF